jgi:hypothetical protein
MRVVAGRATSPPLLPHAREEKGAAANLRERRESEGVRREWLGFPLDLSRQSETLTVDLDRTDENTLLLFVIIFYSYN